MAHEIKESERMKNEFISTVSHELRTPLTAIKGWGETILEDPIKDEALTKRGLNVIISESERLTSLVEELLDFSRMENGNLTMRMSSMSLTRRYSFLRTAQCVRARSCYITFPRFRLL